MLKRSRFLAKAGFTLIEIAISIAVVVILSSVVGITVLDVVEATDAQAVQTTQAVLQNTVTQAASRLDVDPVNLSTGAAGFNGDNIVNACKINVPTDVVLQWLGGTNYQVQLTSRNRSAIYSLNNNGDVQVQTITGFSNYGVVNGVITKL